MHVAIVGTELCAVDRRGGGLEQLLLRWAAGLAHRHTVTVVSHRGPRPGDDPWRTVSVAGPADLRRALAAARPDVVSLHNRPQWAGACPPGAAVGVTFHNYPAAWKVGNVAWSPPRPLACSAVSRALAGAARDRLGVAHVTVVPASVDPAFLRPARWEPEPVVLFPNRLLRKKGVEDLLAVAGRRRFRDVTFAFADLISPWARPTAEHRALRAAVGAVANAVMFPAITDPGALADRYHRAAVVACPVREPEGLGLVALEAQACGVPLVTTRAGGLAEATFAPNRSVPVGDLDALAAALSAGLDDPAWHRRLGQARRRVRERYAPEASASAFEGWLSSCC